MCSTRYPRTHTPVEKDWTGGQGRGLFAEGFLLVPCFRDVLCTALDAVLHADAVLSHRCQSRVSLDTYLFLVGGGRYEIGLVKVSAIKSVMYNSAKKNDQSRALAIFKLV